MTPGPVYLMEVGCQLRAGEVVADFRLNGDVVASGERITMTHRAIVFDPPLLLDDGDELLPVIVEGTGEGLAITFVTEVWDG